MFSLSVNQSFCIFLSWIWVGLDWGRLILPCSSPGKQLASLSLLWYLRKMRNPSMAHQLICCLGPDWPERILKLAVQWKLLKGFESHTLKMIIVGTSFVLSEQDRGIYFWLCASQGHHRVASPGFELGSCRPGTIWATSPDGTRRATVWVKVPSSNPGDVTHKGQINKWPHKTLHCPAHFGYDALDWHSSVVRLGTRAQKADVYVGMSFVLSGQAAEYIFGSVPVRGITEWPPQDLNLGPVGLKA